MENRENSSTPNTGLPNQEFNSTENNRRLQEDIDTTPSHTTSPDSIPLNITTSTPDPNTSKPGGTTLPYEDPAITNPEELASFPKPAPIADAEDVENESENRLVNKRTPVREGRNITQTGNAPDERGYI